MKYQNGVVYYNNLVLAFKIIEGLQNEGEDYYNECTNLIYVLNHRTFQLPSGKKGSIIKLAIEMHRFVAAKLLINNMNYYDSAEELLKELDLAYEYYDGLNKIEKLKAVADEDKAYEKMLTAEKANLDAYGAIYTLLKGETRVR